MTPADLAALGARVTPLEWARSHMTGWDGDFHTVPTGYAVRCADENGWKWSCLGRGAYGYALSPESAKAAAEAHHVAAVLAMIEPLDTGHDGRGPG